MSPHQAASVGRAEAAAAPRVADPGALVVVLYNLLFWPYLLVTVAILFFPALFLFLVTFAWDRHLWILHRYTSVWASHYVVRAPLVPFKLEGAEHYERGGTYVFVSNHQSMVDILAVFATGFDYKWVSKVENFYAPFIGWAMVLNRYVALKRGHLPSILRMFRRCERCLKDGESLFIFPEGTRSPDGELQSFHRGAFVLAARNDVPILPVVIEGTGRILGKGSRRIVPVPVTVRVLPPISPASVGGDDRKLRDLVHDAMAAELAKIRGRAAS
jgi:1-acyl-sn-glycerol-3-phosphate acyltransferase